MAETKECPKCGRLGLDWDGRAGVFMCVFNNCQHVVRPEPEPTIEDLRQRVIEMEKLCLAVYEVFKLSIFKD